MEQTIKQNRAFIIMGLVIFTIQLILDNLNAFGLVNNTKTWIAAGIMLLGAITSVFAQYKDKQIDNNKLWITFIFIGIAIAGAILDGLDKVPFPENIQAGLRLTLTVIIRVVPVWIKTLYPDYIKEENQ
jgi:hypothetical protein